MFQNLVKSLSPFCREQIRRNIETEWIRSANSLCPTRVFFKNEPSNHMEKHTEDIRKMQIQNVLKMYDSELKQWIGQESSFAVIERSPKNDNNIDLSLLLLTPKNETLQQQQCLIRNRNYWYKEHSKSPLASGFKSIVDEEKNQVNIVYEKKNQDDSFPEKTILLDEIHLNTEDSNHDSCLYDILFCKTDLNNCMEAFLDDSYTDCSDGKSVLKLNHALVPFKLAITFEEGIHPKMQTKLFEVVNYLLNQLKECPEINVFPFVKDCILNVESSDSLLIPFCVVVTSDSLKNGVVKLRNRDTRISESVHVSNFLKTIVLYLKPIKLL